ncbi:MAG: hypothetical protein EP338_00405 [Bacteroidetes bacterium]|nr:MAG: hypothetical protein EP338_00405 [Bacteroidota bacterium]
MFKKITLTACIVFSLLFAFGQGKSDYDNDSRWFWNFNVGTTWQTTDVKNKNDWGLGFVIGKSFNYNYGKAISFDIRGRYLFGEWYGQDNVRTNFDLANEVLSQDPTNYKDSLGYSILNFQTKNHRLALELALHANNLRDRTGLDLYVFGGVGLSFFETRGDLRDSLGGLYNYDSIPNMTNSTLKGVMDGNYETLLNGSTGGRNVAFMPSLGFGIGYQAGKRFSLGIEHKTTFTRLDYFDGYSNPDGARANDLYHYTSAYLRFHIKSKKTTYVDVDPVGPPKVYFTTPSSSGTTVSRPDYRIRAVVKDVKGRENINFRQNGVYQGQFTYNASNDRMECNVNLQPGQNVFEIIASNAYGSDQAQTVIIYKQEEKQPPRVNITDPAANPHTVATGNYQLKATIFNLERKDQSSVLLNGRAVSNYNFDPVSGKLDANLNLSIGSNVVTVKGTNEAGSDSETRTIIYNRTALVQAPEVYYTDPRHSPHQVNQGTYNLKAEVRHVAGRENITFKQNGRVNQNFSYDANTDDFWAKIYLNPGQNVFEIIASNPAGEADETMIIIYEKSAPKPPVVTITNPGTSNVTTENRQFPLRATVLNVDRKDQVKLRVNNVNYSNFQFNVTTHQLTHLLNLNEGANVIEVSASNKDGQDSKETVIIYRKVEQNRPPVVSFIHPASTPFYTSESNMRVAATVLNVRKQSEINVNVNGRDFTGFSYEASSNQVSFTFNLLEGANVVTITASNAAGTDSKTRSIYYRKPKTELPPQVSFTDPIANPKTVFDPVYPLEARVQNVNSKNEIELRVNGNATQAFNFNAGSETLTFSTALVEGANIITIQARNAAGTDAASTTIVYQKSEPIYPPQVQISSPASNTYTSSSPSTAIRANIINIERDEDIQVIVNGVGYPGFDFNEKTRILSFVMPLKEGSNTLLITARNGAGKAQDSRTITYRREVKVDPPKVSFIQPNRPGTTVNVANYRVVASVLNVDSKDQIELSQNGRTVSPRLYHFDENRRELSFQAGLNFGNNIFSVVARNKSGSHSASTNITYKRLDVACDKPSVRFLTPNVSGVLAKSQNEQVRVEVKGVESGGDIRFLLNGVALSGRYNAASKQYTINVKYNKGQNTLELIAKNKCGETSVNMIVNFREIDKPCDVPAIQLIQPLRPNITIEKENVEVRFGLVNISDANQIDLQVNGVKQSVNFNKTTHLLIKQVPLKVGMNDVVIIVTNDCGSARYAVKITRKSCEKPKVQISRSGESNNSTTTKESVRIEGAVTGIDSDEEFEVQANGKEVSFVYNKAVGTFTVTAPLKIGMNKIVLTAKNECGQDSKLFAINRKEDENKKPPVIKITNPSGSPYKTQNGAFNVQAVTENVQMSSQVSLLLNGKRINAVFNPKNAAISANISLVPGNNVIQAIATTKFGRSEDSKVIIYSEPEKVEKPRIVLQSPSTCPAELPAGISQISGYILNISNLNQVSIKTNGRSVTSFSPVLVNGKLNFKFNVNLSQNLNRINLDITANTKGGSDALKCVITMKSGGSDGGNCMPKVTAVFSSDSKSVTTRSTKDLSNVVLKYHDGKVQKFDNLSGLSKSFKGTGANAGKCIVGVWIKSGCNQSNAGPGYGEWVANTKNVGDCGSATNEDCKPKVSAVFSSDSKSVTTRSTKPLINVVLKYEDGQEQKFDKLSGNSRTFKGTGANANKCIVGVWIKSGCNSSSDGPNYGEWIPNKNPLKNCDDGKGNNGHGNNEDGIDESNPGKGSGGPNGKTGGSEDDEKGSGSKGGNSGGGRQAPTINNGSGGSGTKTSKPTGTRRGTGGGGL